MLKGSLPVALLAVLPAWSLAAASAPSIPDTLAGDALSEWLEAFNSGDRATYEAFEKAHAPWLQLDEEMQFRERTGGYDLLDISESDKLWLESPDESSKRFAVDEANRNRVIDGAAKLLNQFYVFPDAAEKFTAKLRIEQKRGAYRNITDAETFAIRLSDDLVALSGDRHIAVDFFDEAMPDEPLPSPPSRSTSPRGEELRVREG